MEVVQAAPEEAVIVEPSTSTFNPLSEEKIQKIAVYREYWTTDETQLTSSTGAASWKVNGFLGNNYEGEGSSSSAEYSEIPAVKSIAVAFGIEAEAEPNDAHSIDSIMELIREANFDWKDASFAANDVSVDGSDAYSI